MERTAEPPRIDLALRTTQKLTYAKLNFPVAITLVIAGVIGSLAVLPYALDAHAVSLEPRRAGDITITLTGVVLKTLLSNSIIFSVVVVIGLLAAGRVGLGTPLLDAAFSGTSPPNLVRVLSISIPLGLAVGAVVVLLDALIFWRYLPDGMKAVADVALWKCLLAGLLYGGISEELLTRLFLMSLVVWAISAVWPSHSEHPSAGVFWVAIIVVALLFGLGHLPFTAHLAQLTPLVVLRAILLNGLAGAVYGYLFWRYGLEAAMLSHMSTNIVLQLTAPS